MLILDLAIAGIGIGAVAALAGLGLLVTYQLTGVFNLAFGAIAMFSAYLVWWLVRVVHAPVGVAAVVVVIGVCPLLGLLLDRGVFRPLQRRDASPAETLTATVGVFVLLVGSAFTIWGGQARTDSPSLVSGRVLTLPGDTVVRFQTIVELAVVLAVAAVLALTLRTRAGRNVRAAVDSLELAQLSGIDTGRISAVGWILGSALAGMSGILLAPSLRLDPYTLTLIVLETMAVAVIARLAHPGIAIGAALAIGIAQSELTRFHLAGSTRRLAAGSHLQPLRRRPAGRAARQFAVSPAPRPTPGPPAGWLFVARTGRREDGGSPRSCCSRSHSYSRTARCARLNKFRRSPSSWSRSSC